MNRFMNVLIIFLFTISVFATTASAGDVDVSFRVSQPGFYGRIDIGSYDRPERMHHQPVIIGGPRHHPSHGPVYLQMHPQHLKNRHKQYYRSNFHGRPVYFVNDRWHKKNDAPHPRPRFKGQDGKQYQNQAAKQTSHGPYARKEKNGRR